MATLNFSTVHKLLLQNTVSTAVSKDIYLFIDCRAQHFVLETGTPTKLGLLGRCMCVGKPSRGSHFLGYELSTNVR